MDQIIKTAKGSKSRESSGDRNKTRDPSRERSNVESEQEKLRNEQDLHEVSSINNYDVIKAIVARILINQNILNRKAKIEIEHDEKFPIKPKNNIKPTLRGLSLLDCKILQNWFSYAKGIGDQSLDLKDENINFR